MPTEETYAAFNFPTKNVDSGFSDLRECYKQIHHYSFWL